MPNTYTQIYIQVVFATKGRDIKIKSEVRDEIEKYICGIFSNKKQKVLAMYANPDHLHIFFDFVTNVGRYFNIPSFCSEDDLQINLCVCVWHLFKFSKKY